MITLDRRKTWSTVPLGEAGVLARGRSVHRPRNAKELLDGPYPLVQTGDIASAGLVLSEYRTTYSELGLAQSKLWPAGTLCITIAANIADTAILGFDACFPDSVVGFTPDKSICDVRYVQYWLMLQKRKLEDTATEVAQKNINLRTLNELKIPLPPLEEQRRIAEILDLADGLRAKRRAALAEVEQLTQAVFRELFSEHLSLNIRPLKELLQPIESGKSPVCLQRAAEHGEWGVLKVGAVSRGYWDPTENKALQAVTNESFPHEVGIGDLLFVRKNTYGLVGTTTIVSSLPKARLLMPDLLFRLIPKTTSGLTTVYLNELLRTQLIRDALQRLASGSSSSMPNISKSRLLGLKVPVPPLELQQEFAQRVEAIENLRASHQRSLAEMDALFASLQSRAFKGEL